MCRKRYAALRESSLVLRDSVVPGSFGWSARRWREGGQSIRALDNPQPSNGFCFLWPISGDFFTVHAVHFPSQVRWAWATEVSLDSLSLGVVSWCKSWVKRRSQFGRQRWTRVMSHLLSLDLVRARARRGVNAFPALSPPAIPTAPRGGGSFQKLLQSFSTGRFRAGHLVADGASGLVKAALV